MVSDNSSTTIKCPVCEKSFNTDTEKASLPFCSKRCKLIDRNRWLGEKYGLPYESETTPEIIEPDN